MIEAQATGAAHAIDQLDEHSMWGTPLNPDVDMWGVADRGSEIRRARESLVRGLE